MQAIGTITGYEFGFANVQWDGGIENWYPIGNAGWHALYLNKGTYLEL